MLDVRNHRKRSEQDRDRPFETSFFFNSLPATATSGIDWLRSCLVLLLRSFFRPPRHGTVASLSPAQAGLSGCSSCSGGLEGAVPILLAALAVIAHVQHETYLYGLVYVVVLFSVAIQGTAMPTLATRLGPRSGPSLTSWPRPARSRWRGRRSRTGAAWTRSRSQSGPGRRHPPDGGRVDVRASVLLAPGDQVDVYCEPTDEPALRRIFEGA